jgi:hypothetical protein
MNELLSDDKVIPVTILLLESVNALTIKSEHILYLKVVDSQIIIIATTAIDLRSSVNIRIRLKERS